MKKIALFLCFVMLLFAQHHKQHFKEMEGRNTKVLLGIYYI